ncbi:imidazole glycerol phosphate synthase subunit HisH [Candidatus Symbiobacter mobilis]|uniref:Imidazole glycerol phosphate synthase subunit HisH n=1 Tax=Candidatus Symbiobacter mobilis CR TaxID=946483 RepID=U5N9E1_9BURK|nr:imidazole glycerol phosphate synthase subunit HisH [Candidatus Symbiobacter mobilis]AGX86843.1 glutamine amidotransferase [Candidatus Symbiobacter mobilis CR]
MTRVSCRSPVVAVVDYGMGNLRSVSHAVQRASADSACIVTVTQDPTQVRNADRVILPGQGAMPDCMEGLRHCGLLEAVLDVAASRPLLGICVGMQMLLDRSAEGDIPCLGLIQGDVVRFDFTTAGQNPAQNTLHDTPHNAQAPRCKIPQMGWNQVWYTRGHPVWGTVPDGSWFYFVHSYHVRPTDPAHCMGKADHGGPFCAAIARDNIFATQFHPEKSADQGLSLYRNFLHWNP